MRALLGLALLTTLAAAGSAAPVLTASIYQGPGGYSWCCLGAPDGPTAWLCEANPLHRVLPGTLTIGATHEPAHMVLHVAFTAVEDARTCTEERTCIGFTDGAAWFGPCLVPSGAAWFQLDPRPDGTWDFHERYWAEGYFGAEELTGTVARLAEAGVEGPPLPPLPV